MEIIINNIQFSPDFAAEQIAEITGKPVKEVEAVILAQAKTEGEQFVSEVADQCHDQVSKVSPQKLARYESKANDAKAYKANKATEEQIAGLQKEAAARSITIDEHVDRIITANNLFRNASAEIEAIEADAKAKIRAARTIEELEALKEIIPQKAAEELKKWQAAQGANA